MAASAGIRSHVDSVLRKFEAARLEAMADDDPHVRQELEHCFFEEDGGVTWSLRSWPRAELDRNGHEVMEWAVHLNMPLQFIQSRKTMVFLPSLDPGGRAAFVDYCAQIVEERMRERLSHLFRQSLSVGMGAEDLHDEVRNAAAREVHEYMMDPLVSGLERLIAAAAGQVLRRARANESAVHVPIGSHWTVTSLMIDVGAAFAKPHLCLTVGSTPLFRGTTVRKLRLDGDLSPSDAAVRDFVQACAATVAKSVRSDLLERVAALRAYGLRDEEVEAELSLVRAGEVHGS